MPTGKHLTLLLDMNFTTLIESTAKEGAILISLLIITSGAAVALEQVFPRDQLRAIFAHGGFLGSVTTALGSVIFPGTAGGKITLAARFREAGVGLPQTLIFILAGSALSLPGIALTLSLGWRLAVLRLCTAVVFGAMVGAFAHIRLRDRLKKEPPAGWLEAFHPDYCDVRPELEEWEATYPRDAWFRALIANFRILAPWLVLSLVIALILQIAVTPAGLAGFFGKWWSPLFAAASGFPFFFAGGADVPILKVMAARGVPLSALVAFMTGAPVVNFPVFLILGRWLGRRVAISILVYAWLGAAALGWIVSLAALILRLSVR
ncbi:MAG: permease [Chloroflexi bacterium]|nr:permease [Chloroflexota bacterium]